jgi:hypothetical protein
VSRKDGLSDLLITHPYRHDSSFFPSGGDIGGAYIWKGGSGFPKGIVSDLQRSSDSCIVGKSHKELLGKTAAILDFNGDGKMDLLLGAPRDHSVKENAGSVALIFTAFD